jgi:alkylation response protein AidB-like acyl-CoA dehydrogenase
MNFALDEEQERLRATARAFLAECSSSPQVRAAMDTPLGWDPAVWRRIAAELGWTAVIVPEQYGGLGLTQVELAVLMEEMGSALLCSPFFSTVCLAANALVLGGSEEQRRELLRRVAAGEITATVAWTEPNGRWDASAIEAVARRTPDGGFVLGGRKTFVLDGHSADLILVAARRAGSSGPEGVSLFAIPADVAGLRRRALATMDRTRRQAELTLDDVRAPASALLGEEGEGWRILGKTLQLAAVALSAEQVGGAQRCLDMAVDYAKQRVQFGRPIGSFQAIKHKCADMLVRVESARSASYFAACTAAEDGEDLPLAASLAKAYCSDAYFRCAADNVQIHGGIGFTWEHDAHLYLKRAKSSETLLGDASHHRELVARRIGL